MPDFSQTIKPFPVFTVTPSMPKPQPNGLKISLSELVSNKGT